MDEPSEDMLYQGVSIDIVFGESRPSFGDLFCICGVRHPRFPPSGAFGFERLADLQFVQVDDYFGVRSLAEGGVDVAIWLYPLVDGKPVDHHPGPFDGVRLGYDVLRNPVRRAQHFLRCLQEFAVFGSGVVYRTRGISLGVPPDLTTLRADIAAIVQHWGARGISVGSDDALSVDV